MAAYLRRAIKVSFYYPFFLSLSLSRSFARSLARSPAIKNYYWFHEFVSLMARIKNLYELAYRRRNFFSLFLFLSRFSCEFHRAPNKIAKKVAKEREKERERGKKGRTRSITGSKMGRCICNVVRTIIRNLDWLAGSLRATNTLLYRTNNNVSELTLFYVYNVRVRQGWTLKIERNK